MEQTTQKIVEETAKMGENGMLITLVGGLLAGAGATVKFIFGRLDKKVDKETFKQFEEKNQQAHDFTHTTLKEIKKKLG